MKDIVEVLRDYAETAGEKERGAMLAAADKITELNAELVKERRAKKRIQRQRDALIGELAREWEVYCGEE